MNKLKDIQNKQNKSQWKNLFSEISYERALFNSDFKELKLNSFFIIKKMIKKITHLSSNRIKQRSKNYSPLVRRFVLNLCKKEDQFLNSIKSVEQQKQEDSIFGPK